MRYITAIMVLFLTASAPSATAQRRFDAGARINVSLGSGVPANDIPGQGLFGHYRINERWALGFGFDTSHFDFEEPAKRLRLPVDPDAEVVDSKVDATIVSAWLERRFGNPASRGEWFAGTGIGFASLDAPDARGNLEGGGTFDIATDAGTEILVSALGGRRVRFGERWAVELSLHAEHHFADWKLEDRISGTTGTIDDYFAYGGRLGLTFSF